MERTRPARTAGAGVPERRHEGGCLHGDQRPATASGKPRLPGGATLDDCANKTGRLSRGAPGRSMLCENTYGSMVIVAPPVPPHAEPPFTEVIVYAVGAAGFTVRLTVEAVVLWVRPSLHFTT